MEILVCDDHESGFQAVASAVGDRHSLRPLVGKALEKELESLFRRVSSALSKERRRAEEWEPTRGIFDRAAVVVIDNNLAALELAGARLTAEAMIGYVRAFTAATYVVSLNKNPDVDFDLRYLVGDYQSQADVALNTPHLSSEALWGGRGASRGDGEEFGPWYWPNLPAAVLARQDQVRQIEAGGLEESVVKLLHFDTESVEALSRRARGPLSPEGEDDSAVRDVTVLDFFRNACRALPAEDRESLAEWATDRADVAARRWVSRLVASDLEKWIRRDVLGPQDVLVDLPHLLIRMPFLLGGRAGDAEAWNRVLNESEEPFGLLPDVYKKHVRHARFDTSGSWTGSPCFWWSKLKADDELEKLFFSSGDEWADVAFCEDVSRFRPLADAGPPGQEYPRGPVEFEAEFEGTWTRRHVARLPDKQYAPRSRFAR